MSQGGLFLYGMLGVAGAAAVAIDYFTVRGQQAQRAALDRLIEQDRDARALR